MNNNNIFKINTLVLLLFLFSNLAAQNSSIKGKVINAETNAFIHGVNVFIKNTTIGTITNKKGEFLLNKPPYDTITIVFSFVGFETQEKIITGEITSSYQIKLNPLAVTLEEVVVITAKNQLTRFKQITPVSIISEKNITENSTQNIADIITREPSVSLAGQAYHRAPSIRGLARKRVVVMVDGDRISSERNPGAPGTFVNPLDIKNIEILRGPYSTLYGSDAVGGVINIITQDYKETLTNKYIGGAFKSNYQSISNGYNVNLLINSKIADKFFIHLTAGKRKANSYKDADGKEVMGTNFDENSFSAKLTFKPNQHHKLQFKTFLSMADSIGKPAYSDSINALHPEDNHYKFGINYQWKNINSWFSKMTIKTSFHKHLITGRIYNYKSIQYGRVMNQNKNLYNNDYVYQHDFHFIVNHDLKILAGLDFYQRDDIHIDEQKRAYLYDTDNPQFNIGELVYNGPQDTTIDNSYQRSFGVFAHANYSLSKKILLKGGLRWNTFNTHANLVKTTQIGPPYDYNKNLHETKIKKNEAFSSNLGISFIPEKNVNITANIGQAFRVPSTKELFINTITPGGMNFCNPDLVPEKSFNIDLGAKFRDKKNNSSSISLFRNKINDMIILKWDSLHATGEFNNQNAVIYGGEFSFYYKIIKKLPISGNISYIKGYDNNDEVLMDIPPLQVNLETKYFIESCKIYLAIAGKYSAKQEEFATGDFPTDDFFVFDFLSGWEVNEYFQINFSIKNILNKDYREHYQFDWLRQPGRSFNASLSFNF
ncbi:MAG: TonB-dependent receptor [Bacteroidales bacterium]|nr:TonB-dependent receptor [Bacteroidales bacterium]